MANKTQQAIQRSMRRSNSGAKLESHGARMGTSVASMLQSLILVLIGLYIGISISGLHLRDESSTNSIASSSIFQSSHHVRGGTYGNNNENHTEISMELKKSQDEIKRLKSIAQTLDDKHASSLKKIEELENSCSTKDEKKLELHPAKVNSHPLCQSILSHPVPTAMDLWNQHILKTLSASRFIQDTKFQFHDFTTQLLQIISPRLPRSVKTTPFDWRPVENALTVAWERFQYLQLPKKQRDAIPISDKPRPLKILVMGGSLLVGTNCAKLKREMGFEFGMPRRECNWSSRLGHFLNGFFLGEKSFDPKEQTEPLIQLAKVAMGGTNTATGSVIWQYDLIPEEAHNPDIVINAYSTNDMHILTVLEAESSNSTLRDRTFEMIQSYVRQIMGSKQCSSSDELIPPLLMHMDDYLGNEQRKIWETTELAQGAQVLANYYGFVSMSYADVVREFVYGDTYERWFSSEWWVPESGRNNKNLIFDRQIHPGMGMHISSIWVAAYNLLNLASTYCSMPTDVVRHLSKNSISEYKAGLWGLPDLTMTHKQAIGKPQSQPEGLPPELTKELLLEEITSLWRQQSKAINVGGRDMERLSNSGAQSCKLDQNIKNGVSSTTKVKCPFSWVSGLSLQQNNVTWVNEFFKEQSSTWEGWELSEDGGKIGFIPSAGAANEANVRMILDFMYAQKIQSITIFFMKSYGDKWQNSELKATVWSHPSAGQQDQILLDERNLFGTHDKNTSEMYTEEIILSKPVDAGEKIQLEAKLVGGETFKLMGIAVCS
jgi:hypothetical protein